MALVDEEEGYDGDYYPVEAPPEYDAELFGVISKELDEKIDVELYVIARKSKTHSDN